MAQVNLPQTLSAAYWDKQKAALAKASKPPATKLPEELKELTKQHLALDWREFDTASLKTAEDADDRLSALDKAEKGKIKALLGQAQAVEKSASSFEAEAKKDKAFPKDVLTAVAAILKAAKAYRDEVDSAVEASRKALQAEMRAMEQEASDQEGGDSASTIKQTKLLKSRLLTAIAALRKPQPNARTMRFMIVQGKSTAGLALGYSVGPTQEKLLKGLMPGESPYRVIKDLKTSEVVWEKNVLTFVSDKLSGTLIKKVQLWLKKLIKLNLKMRLRKSSGEVEEIEGEDISDDQLKVDPVEASVDKDEFMARLGEMQPAIKAGLTGASAAKLKGLMAEVTQLSQAGKFNDADTLLDEVEALLAPSDETEAPETETTEDTAPTGAKPPDEAALTRRLAALQPAIKAALTGPEQTKLKEALAGITQLSKAGKMADAGKLLDAVEALLKKTERMAQAKAQAVDEWKSRRATAVTSLKSVAAKVAEAKHASSAKAILELQAVIKNLTAEPSTLQQVTDLQKWLADDEVVNDVCELAEDIRTPLLGALTQLRSAIAA